MSLTGGCLKHSLLNPWASKLGSIGGCYMCLKICSKKFYFGPILSSQVQQLHFNTNRSRTEEIRAGPCSICHLTTLNGVQQCTNLFYLMGLPIQILELLISAQAPFKTIINLITITHEYSFRFPNLKFNFPKILKFKLFVKVQKNKAKYISFKKFLLASIVRPSVRPSVHPSVCPILLLSHIWTVLVPLSCGSQLKY